MTGPIMFASTLPALPGSYALLFSLPETVTLAVGRLGVFEFPDGDYLYLGSAHGSGGLRARIAHHVRTAAQPHWHLDWLRPRMLALGGWFSTASGNLECTWSQSILRLPGTCTPAPGFGAADCRSRCVSHLVRLPESLNNQTIELLLAETNGGISPTWVRFI